MPLISRIGGGASDKSLGLTAVAEDILSGKTAAVNGAIVTGNMPNIGKSLLVPTTYNVTIPQGYHDGTGVVFGATNFLPANIKKGVEMFGVVGTLSEGLTIEVINGGGYGGTAYNWHIDFTAKPRTPRLAIMLAKNNSNQWQLLAAYFDATIASPTLGGNVSMNVSTTSISTNFGSGMYVGNSSMAIIGY